MRRVVPLLVTLLLPALALAEARAPSALGLGRETLRQHRGDRPGRHRPGLSTLVKGRICAAQPRRGGKKVGEGSIPIRPDVEIHPKVQQITGLTPTKLAGAKRFEAVAGQILELMKGRVLIGQSAVKKDWSWLVSNFARIGVDLPGPKKMIMDTYYMSFHHNPAGEGLKALTRRFGVRQQNHHDARYDAEATAGVFFRMMQRQGITTLGQAFTHQQQGEAIMRQRWARAALIA